MGVFTIYPPRGEYEGAGAGVGQFLGNKIASLLIPDAKAQEQKQSEEFFKALSSLQEQVGHLPDARDRAWNFVSGAIQSGRIRVQDANDWRTLGEAVDSYFPERKMVDVQAFDPSGNPGTLRVRADRPIGSGQDIQAALPTAPGNLSLFNPGQVEKFDEKSGTFLGKDKASQPDPQGTVTGPTLKARLDMQALRRGAQEEEMTGLKLRDLKDGKEDPEKDAQYKAEARGMLRRRGLPINAGNMDRAVEISARKNEASRILFTIAGGKIKDNEVMWDNDGNQARYTLATTMLEQHLWDGMDEGNAAAAAWTRASEVLPKAPPPVPSGQPQGGTPLLDSLRKLFNAGGKGEDTPAPTPAPAAKPAAPAPAAKPAAAAPKASALPLKPDGKSVDESKLSPDALYEFKGAKWRWDPKSKKLTKVKE